MRTKISRRIVCGVLSFALCLSASAATRICSVYAESFAALQKQIFLGAEAFQAPMLGMLPMMITGGLPGAALMNNDKPIAMHILDTGEGMTSMVVEVTPSGAPDAYLRLLAGLAEGTELPAPADGIYSLGKGMAAKIAGGRVFFVQNARKPKTFLTDDIVKLSEMPALPGVIRVTVEPAALAPMLKNAMAGIPMAGQDAAQGRAALEGFGNLYADFLGQVEVLHLGLNIQKEGLFIRSRMQPKAGSDVAALVASAKPVAAKQLVFIDKDSLYSQASGGSTLPAKMKQGWINAYLGIMATALPDGTSTNAWIKQIEESVAMLEMPSAFTIALPKPEGPAQVQGCWEVSDPAGFLARRIEQYKDPSFAQMLGTSGAKITESSQRESKGMKIVEWKFELDEAAAEKELRAKLPADMPAEDANTAVASSMETMRKIFAYLKDGYEYGAGPKDVFLGMGAGQVEAAAERAKAATAKAEADRIETLLAPSGDPTSMGRLALSKIVGLVMANDPQLAGAVKAVPPGEGIAFAGWNFKGEALSATLIQASEIKALMALGMSMQARAGAGRNATPARPPIPDNF